MVYLYIIQCKNCSAVLYCGIVLGRIWTDQGRHKAVDKTAFPTIGNAHHSHPQPLPILPITTALLKHSCMLKRIASRPFKLWQLLEPLQVFASSFPPAGEGGWEIKGWTDRSRTLQLQPIKWKTPPIEGCSKHPWQVSAVINAMTSILKELLWIINSIWWSQNTDIYSYDIISDQSRIFVPMLDESGEMVLEILLFQLALNPLGNDEVIRPTTPTSYSRA